MATPLHLATIKRDLAEVKRLLQTPGYDVNTVITLSISVASPLYFATAGHHLEIAQALLDAGADIEGNPAAENFTPFQVAALQNEVLHLVEDLALKN